MEQVGGESSSGWSPTEGQPIFFTPAAVEAVKRALATDGEEGEGLRVSVQGGGCAGYNYGLDFDREERADDVVMFFDEVKILIDPMSADILRGTVVDYVKSLQGEGFKFNNPNAKRTCGCGNSFG